MSQYDIDAKITLDKLSKCYNIKIDKQDDIICPYTVGAEIEVKFRHYFPDIFDQYFNDGTPFRNRTELEQDEINKKIELKEVPLLKKLESTIECGIPKGSDRYWEFAFNPVNNLTLLYQQIDILKKIQLIPSGQQSLHLTIGMPSTKNSFYILLMLELLFLKKERIKEGFHRDENYSGTWSKKGMGGIFNKSSYDLIGCDKGFEFRTLEIYYDTDILNMFRSLNDMLVHGYNFDVIRNEMLRCGLPDNNWETPKLNPTVWNLYIDKFDHLKEFVKNIKLK